MFRNSISVLLLWGLTSVALSMTAGTLPLGLSHDGGQWTIEGVVQNTENFGYTIPKQIVKDYKRRFPDLDISDYLTLFVRLSNLVESLDSNQVRSVGFEVDGQVKIADEYFVPGQSLVKSQSKQETGEVIGWMRLLESISENPLFEDSLVHLFLRKQEVVRGLFKKGTYPVVRERYFDDLIRENIADAEQVVFLGVGKDTRTYRMPELSQVPKIFEVDLPDVIAQRNQVFGEASLKTSATVVRLGLTVGSPNWEKQLLQNGFDQEVKTVFVTQGMQMYLTPEQLESFLHGITHLAGQGSVYIGDFITPSVVTELDLWHSGIEPEELSGVYGWNVEIIYPNDPRANYERYTKKTTAVFYAIAHF